MLKLFGRTTSFNVQKVLWLADELSLNYEHVELGGKFGGLDTPDFAQINPLQKVPVLVDGDKSVWESHTILRYLIAEYGNKTWYPDSGFERSLYERWIDWSQTSFQPAFMGVFWGYYRKPSKKRDMNSVSNHLKKCIGCLATLDRQLSDSKYLAGDKITLADIPAGAVIYRLTEQGIDVSLPSFVANWYENLKLRDGYQKWVMSDFTELKAREEF
jgi:glutathione S-transferase